MSEVIRRVIRRSSPYRALQRWLDERRDQNTIGEWERRGRPAPPPHAFKAQTIRRYGAQFGLRTLIETGTFQGDMVEQARRHFDRVFSIELSELLHQRALERFRAANNVKLIHGDSSQELKKLLGTVRGPALFWLDGHYSEGETARGAKDTPVIEELADIMAASERGHVVLIDDARCFGRDQDYPTIETLSRFVAEKRPDWQITVEDDIIRLAPGAR